MIACDIVGFEDIGWSGFKISAFSRLSTAHELSYFF